MNQANPNVITHHPSTEVVISDKVTSQSSADTPALSVRIIYNPHNIDSCLATTIITERIKQSNPVSKVQTIGVDFATHDSAAGDVDYLVICGVRLTNRAFLHEVDLCNPAKVIRFNYLGEKDCDANPSNDAPYIQINPARIANIDTNSNNTVEDVGEEQIVGENSICFLANEYFYRALNFGGPATEYQSRLMSIVTRYINFDRFAGIWETDPVTKKVSVRESNDLAFLYRNVAGIRFAAENGLCHLIPVGGVEDSRTYKGEISRIRKIIHRNLQNKIYSSKQKLFQAMTVCVGEDDAFEVMRQLNHSFSTAITYEDTSDARLWRVMTKDQRVIGLLKEILEPTRSWTDCKIVYLACDLPKVNENVN